MLALRSAVIAFGRTFTQQQAAPALTVFLAYFVSAKLAEYIFFILDSAPSVIWLPAGIALAAVLYGGMRMWLPIACAQLCVSMTSVMPPSVPFVLAETLAATLQPLAAGYILRRFGFLGTFGTVRGTLLFIGVASTFSLIYPGIIWVAREFMSMTYIASPMWSDPLRGWTAHAFSLLLIPSLITSWRTNIVHADRRHVVEVVTVFTVLAGTVYTVFWTPLGQPLGLPLICTLWLTLFWISIRLAPRYMSTAIIFIGGIAVLGAILSNPYDSTLGQQIFGDQMIILLFAPIFMVFAAVVEERRATTSELAGQVEELDRLTRKLSADDRAKNEFIAVLAHELRNPLAPMVSTLELLKIRHENDAESLELIETGQQQSDAMRRLLDDLLDVARIAQNKFSLLTETIDLRDVLTSAKRSTENLMRERHHEFIVSLPQSAVYLEADAVRLEQVLVNLLNNAAKYTPPSGRVELWCDVAEEKVAIHVRDSGIGVSAEDIKSIFLPFRQTGVEPHRGSGGLGIGLALTKRLVEMHGGSIEAQSHGPGKGSHFTVRLPLASSAATAASVSDTMDTSQGNAHSILVVDDNEAAARGLGKLLAHRGHRVHLAYGGEEGLRVATSEKPDVILLDIGMPGMDGYDVARQLRGEGVEALLVAITGYGQERDKQRSYEAGFDEHLTKPVGLRELESVLRTRTAPAA